MRIRFVWLLPLALALAGCSTFPFGGGELPAEDFRSEYASLSGGDGLEHWVVMGNPEGFRFADGVIRSEGGRGGGWLRSKRTYADFSLRLEYRVSPGGNSGVFFRCADVGNPWETGYESQISNEQPPRDDLHCTGSLYGYVPAGPRPDESPEVWHTMEILCKNKRIIILVDGRATVNVDQDTVPAIAGKPLEGFIGLQDAHAGEGHWVEFRNVEIQELNGNG